MSSTFMPLYRVTQAIRATERWAFRFVGLEPSCRRLAGMRAERMEDIGGRVSPAWIFLSVLGLFAAVGFGIYAAYNAQGAIAGFIDPLGSGVVSLQMLYIIGLSITIVGMLCGHLMQEGFASGISRDPYTGSRSVSSKLWLGVLGLLGAIAYVGFQFFLVKTAGSNVESGDPINHLPYLIVGIAVLELFIGAVVLHRAFAYIMLFATTLVLIFAHKRLNRSARRTNDHYQNYLTLLQVYNAQNPNAIVTQDGNENIRRAISFFRGIPDSAVANPGPADIRGTASTPVSTTSAPDQGGQARTVQTQREVERELETHLADTVDDDVTF